MFVNMGR